MNAKSADELTAACRAAEHRHAAMKAQWPKVRLATWICAGIAIALNLEGVDVAVSLALTGLALVASVVHVETTRKAAATARRLQKELSARGVEVLDGES